MSDHLAPGSSEEMAEVVRSCPALIAIGAGTKNRLSALDVTKVASSRLVGMVEYEPSEFTFTVRAGTPIRQIIDVLGKRGQYLPFDPMLVDAGATLGGTVAAGLSGPGRLRFGGLKDFILGVQFVDGLGRVLRVGGKVVKNAAGFDLPKFLVGSQGRFGVLTELTFKVFPAPTATVTLKVAAKDVLAMTRILVELARHRSQPQALDVLPGRCEVYVRLAGPAAALAELTKDILANYTGEELSAEIANSIWGDVREFKWCYPGGPLTKVVLTPKAIPDLVRGLQRIDGARIHISSGGNMAFVALPSPEPANTLNELLRGLSLSALTLRGDGPLWCGTQLDYQIAKSVKSALDPQNRFPALDA